MTEHEGLELKPCPLCASTDIDADDNGTDEQGKPYEMTIWCNGCQSRFIAYPETWNRRPSPAKSEAAVRYFPIMGGPKIPWSMIEPYSEQAESNHGQTLERLAERGGLDIDEATAVLTGQMYSYQKRTTLEAFIALVQSRSNPAPHPDVMALRDALATLKYCQAALSGYVPSPEWDTQRIDLLTQIAAALSCNAGGSPEHE